MIVSVKHLLSVARREGFAVGAFNIVNVETAQAVLGAAREKDAPVILQFTESTLRYLSLEGALGLLFLMEERVFPEVVASIHLDHGKHPEHILQAIQKGIPSVMYDGSRSPYEENLQQTKSIVEAARKRGVDVQAELGNVPYQKEVAGEEIRWEEYMTDPEQAEAFVQETGVDTLAVAIGNAHGLTKERSEPDYERLKEIARRLPETPLVLHGASDWEGERVKKVIKEGISCFNVDTSTRTAFVEKLQETLTAKEVSRDIRFHLGMAREAAQKSVEHKIELFQSTGKASLFRS